MIIVDTSIIVAYMNSTDDHHTQVSEWLDGEQDDFVTTPLVIAEVDHLVAARGGPGAASALRADLLAGAYLVEWWAGAIVTSVRVAEQHADGGLGLTDASLVALADHVGTSDIATLDERHFRAVRPLTGGDAFRLLPRDR
ncbi:MAG: PIN domain-containing protein [Solirubrobacteraceae bacterium]